VRKRGQQYTRISTSIEDQREMNLAKSAQEEPTKTIHIEDDIEDSFENFESQDLLANDQSMRSTLKPPMEVRHFFI
jgi:hypothetical protein